MFPARGTEHGGGDGRTPRPEHGVWARSLQRADRGGRGQAGLYSLINGKPSKGLLRLAFENLCFGNSDWMGKTARCYSYLKNKYGL